MKAALLPLDDRPYNLAFVIQLAHLAEIEMVVPPSEHIGWFFNAGDSEALAEWLLDLPEDVEAVIVALDMLACGGLLASRSESIVEEEAKAHLDTLVSLREQRPELRILAFDTILRTSLSARDPESRRVHRLLHRWTTLASKVNEVDDPLTHREFDEVSAAIPTQVLERYQRVRERKHAVNCHALELAGKGVIDVLHLLMEDVGPEGDRYGIHKQEQDALRRRTIELGITDRVFLHNGTDEGACTLLARLVTERFSLTPSIYVCYSATDGAAQVPTFEDRRFADNIDSFVRAAGAHLTDSLDHADAILAVHSPYGEPPDLESFAAFVASSIRKGTPVALVDTTTNTADLEMMDVLKWHIRLDDLAAFSAWNTACNSLGTALAQLVISLLKRGSAEHRELNRRLVIERLLDDYIYEGIVRPRLNEALENAGVNPWDLQDAADTVRRDVAKEMQAETVGTLHPYIATEFEFSVTLPWPRTFEPAITVRRSGSGHAPI